MFMRKLFAVALFVFIGLASQAFAQEEKEMSPEEVAEKEVKALIPYLGLSDSQEFYVDSILVHNYTGLKDAFEDLKTSGRVDPEIYNQTKDLWTQKILDAMKKVLDEQQYIKYLRKIGRGKEYKKGKDGKFYLKSELKKKKEK